MMTAAQMRAARALLGIHQKKLAELSGGFTADDPADGGERRKCPGVIDSLTEVVGALEAASN